MGIPGKFLVLNTWVLQDFKGGTSNGTGTIIISSVIIIS